MNRKIYTHSIILLIFIFVLGEIGAVSTVSLTGSCEATLVNGKNLSFTINNTGNIPATNLLISPRYLPAYGNSTYNISIINPNQSITIYIPINESVPGTYATAIVVAYQQPGGSFVTEFPCLFNYIKPTISSLYVTSSISKVENRNATVNVSIFNAAAKTLNFNLTLFAPPTFQVKPTNMQMSIGPYNRTNVSFIVSFQSQQASYPISAVVSYESNNLHYSLLSTTVLSLFANNKSALIVYAPILIIITVIIILVLLLIIALHRKRKAKRSTEEEKEKREKQGHEKEHAGNY